MSFLTNLLFPRTPPPTPITLSFTTLTNPYTARHPWPPNFALLSRTHKFRLERRYRRRTQLKWARPQWKKFTTLAQWGSILWVVAYGALYLDMGRGRTVLDEVREWGRGSMAQVEDSSRRDSKGVEEGRTAAQKG
ncbi:hypothetical protein LTR53_002367 [Teratosphaeriaceae sp. CCFEE 6253]|nr:hypothetical protein LTR53_002367 [Teratosphaeriaceae sp. CCFEE 6253]